MKREIKLKLKKLPAVDFIIRICFVVWTITAAILIIGYTTNFIIGLLFGTKIYICLLCAISLEDNARIIKYDKELDNNSKLESN